MSLSAHLSKCTGDTYYLDTAVLTANCIKNYMVDSELDVVKDCTVDAWNGKVAESGNPSVFLTGVFLEGLSILASASGDEAWRQLSLKIANASMKMAKWHRNGWILSPTAGYSGSADAVTNSKGILIRGLRHVWNQDPHDSASRTSIQRYINVQYNALLDYARIGNYYSNEWTKPTIEPSTVGQMAALDVVSAAIEVNQ
ncbi:hypothetical protein FRC02_009885 [Tulasnella sp. 418]|nr:hypothetical protein FRC02_009885 [Tulasnella sp. 418]